MKRRHLTEEGFTLLEVMTSMLILSFSLLLLLHLAMIALDGNKWASGTTSCTQLMQEKLETLRASTNPESGSDVVGQVSREWTVSTAGTHLRDVSITATWAARDSVVQTNTIHTMIKTSAP